MSGSILGGLAMGGTVTAATVEGRYIVDTKGLSQGTLKRSDLTIVHDLPEVNLAVVISTESDVDALGVDYGVDTSYDIDSPITEAPITAAESATDDPRFWPSLTKGTESRYSGKGGRRSLDVGIFE
ncbi:hypothetical protein [Haladaptatus sp. NG-SE-30]